MASVAKNVSLNLIQSQNRLSRDKTVIPGRFCYFRRVASVATITTQYHCITGMAAVRIPTRNVHQ